MDIQTYFLSIQSGITKAVMSYLDMWRVPTMLSVKDKSNIRTPTTSSTVQTGMAMLTKEVAFMILHNLRIGRCDCLGLCNLEGIITLC